MPRPTKEKNTRKNMSTSPEYLAFKEAYYRLSVSLSHPEVLAALLWSEGFITSMERRDAEDASKMARARAIGLLDVISNKIELQAEKLKQFVTILRQDTSFKDLAMILEPAREEPQLSASQPRVDTNSMSEKEMQVWLKKIGLPDRDIELLIDEGFGTGPGFMTLEKEDINDMKFTKGGKKLLLNKISTISDTVSMDTTPAIAELAGLAGVPPPTPPPESITADDICDEIGLPPYVLDTEFPDQYSVNLSFAKLIPDWKVFAQGLGLSLQDIRGIETNISLTIMMKTTETIKMWKSRFGFKARYRMLVDVALQHELLSLAKQFCGLLLKMVGRAPVEPVCSRPPAKVVTMNVSLDSLLVALEPLHFSRSYNGQLSRALRVPDSKLSEFEANNYNDIRQVRTEILKDWLRQGEDISWHTVASAVLRIGDQNLSRKLMAYRIPPDGNND